MDKKECLLSLTVLPAMEETLVDWLLENHGETGFSRFAVDGHSSQTQGLSLAEQVVGRRKQVRFEIHLSQEQIPVILEQLRTDFTGAGMQYWISPLLGVGRI